MTLVQIAVYRSIQIAEADLLRARLEAEGIHCHVTGRNSLSQADKIVVRVREPDAAAAFAILHDFERGDALGHTRYRSTQTPFLLRTAVLAGLLFAGLNGTSKFFGHPIDDFPIQICAGSGCALVSLAVIKLTDQLRAHK